MAQWLLHPITHSPINLFILFLLIPHSLPAAGRRNQHSTMGWTNCFMDDTKSPQTDLLNYSERP
jgi:hypothetical protein